MNIFCIIFGHKHYHKVPIGNVSGNVKCSRCGDHVPRWCVKLIKKG